MTAIVEPKEDDMKGERQVTISLGVSTLFDSDFASPEDLLGAADKYLYRAKRAGRNRVDAMQISGP